MEMRHDPVTHAAVVNPLTVTIDYDDASGARRRSRLTLQVSAHAVDAAGRPMECLGDDPKEAA